MSTTNTKHTPGATVLMFARHMARGSLPRSLAAAAMVDAQELIAALAAVTAQRDQCREALRRATPWLGKLIADGGHLASVAPNDAIGAMEQSEAALRACEDGAAVA